MIHTMRTFVLRNAAGRLIFASGVVGLVLSGIYGVLQFDPALARVVNAALPVMVQQQVLLVSSLVLFLIAYGQARLERHSSRSFVSFVLDFWQFPFAKETALSHRLLEWAHLLLIAVMFHRALFL